MAACSYRNHPSTVVPRGGRGSARATGSSRRGRDEVRGALALFTFPRLFPLEINLACPLQPSRAARDWRGGLALSEAPLWRGRRGAPSHRGAPGAARPWSPPTPLPGRGRRAQPGEAGRPGRWPAQGRAEGRREELAGDLSGLWGPFRLQPGGAASPGTAERGPRNPRASRGASRDSGRASGSLEPSRTPPFNAPCLPCENLPNYVGLVPRGCHLRASGP